MSSQHWLHYDTWPAKLSILNEVRECCWKPPGLRSSLGTRPCSYACDRLWVYGAAQHIPLVLFPDHFLQFFPCGEKWSGNETTPTPPVREGAPVAGRAVRPITCAPVPSLVGHCSAMAELRSEEKSSPENEGMRVVKLHIYAHAGAGYHCLTSQTVNGCTWRSAAWSLTKRAA